MRVSQAEPSAVSDSFSWLDRAKTRKLESFNDQTRWAARP